MVIDELKMQRIVSVLDVQGYRFSSKAYPSRKLHQKPVSIASSRS
jgi:hypothetical protein